LIFGRKSVDRPGGSPLEFVLIGLSKENLERLQSGQPITIGPHEKDYAMSNMQIVITTGETDQDVMDALKKVGLIDPDVQLNG
jgi:hypothetical protein